MNSDIQFPEGFVALKKLPGYFFNTQSKQLFSLKVTGVLRPLKRQIASSKTVGAMAKHGLRDVAIGEGYYNISHKGKKKTLLERRISAKLDFNHVIPLQAGLYASDN
jgi:hypothetical protein